MSLSLMPQFPSLAPTLRSPIQGWDYPRKCHRPRCHDNVSLQRRCSPVYHFRQELLTALEAVAIQYHQETQLAVLSYIQVVGRMVYGSTKGREPHGGRSCTVESRDSRREHEVAKSRAETMHSAVSLSFLIGGGDNIPAKYGGGRPGGRDHPRSYFYGSMSIQE